MKYIGPFLRINTLNKENIQNQLFHLSKENLKNLVLTSKCGIVTSIKDLKIKNLTSNDIITFKDFSPLLCIYKKGNCKLVPSNEHGDHLDWNEEKFKKEICVCGNALMTLSLLELIDYYKKFETADSKKYNLETLYLDLCKKQLEFAASYFRDEDGLFVDKKDLSNPLTDEIKFVEKNKAFNFSDQALYMAAFYKYSTLDNKEAESYRNFSMDIFNMFLQCKEELYQLSFTEITKVCLGLNLFLKYSNINEAKLLLLDLSELLIDIYKRNIPVCTDDKLGTQCLMFINCILIYMDTGILKFKDICEDIHEKLLDLYTPELGIFIKVSDKKELDFSCDEIMLYLLSLMLYSNIRDIDTDDVPIIMDVYRHQVINSGIIMSWPEAPDLDSIERYNGFSFRSEDLMEEQNFRMSSLPTPENSEIAPVFLKHIVYNRKKESFLEPRMAFDSTKNLLIFFIIVHFFKG